jgi:N-methylhydantoinase A
MRESLQPATAGKITVGGSMMEKRAIRIGIDVGGTHTNAVAIDNNTNEIVGKGSVMTTHFDKQGVAKGVVDAFEKCISENNIKPEEVIFIAHSTTQARRRKLPAKILHLCLSLQSLSFAG